MHVIGIDNTHTDTEISSLIGQLGVLDSDSIRASPWQPHRPDDWRIFLNIFQEAHTHTEDWKMSGGKEYAARYGSALRCKAAKHFSYAFAFAPRSPNNLSKLAQNSITVN